MRTDIKYPNSDSAGGRRPRRRVPGNVCLIAATLLLSVAVGVIASWHQAQRDTRGLEGALWHEPKALQDFAAIDNNNQRFGLSELRGKWSFLFFGYTHCPDICPITLAVMDQVHERLDDTAVRARTQTIFISVDPRRDTPGRLRQYLAYFNPGFIGLSGSAEQVAGIADQIGAAYYVDETSDSQEYLVDHSGSLFLVDPGGRLVAKFSAPHDMQTIIDQFNRVRRVLATRART